MRSGTMVCTVARVMICVAVLIACGASGAAEPVGWRTDGTGRYADARVPMQWSGEQNVLWSTPMPERSNAIPCIVGNRIFICAEPEMLLCVDAADGQILWQVSHSYLDLLDADAAAEARQIVADAEQADQKRKELPGQLKPLQRKLKKNPDDAELTQQVAAIEQEIQQLQAISDKAAPYRRPDAHGVNGHSSPTPVSDGQHVYVLAGNGVAAAYDLNGSRRWARLIERPTHGWGQSSSPALIDDKLFVLINRLYAVDKDTGEEVWQTASDQHWGSPVPTRIGEVDVIVTPGGDIIRAADGHALAQDLAKLEFNAPLVQDDVIYFMQGKPAAYRLPKSVEGDSITPEKLWPDVEIKGDRYYASPVCHDGIVYAIQKTSFLTAMDAATGQRLYEQKLDFGEGTIYPSLIVAGNVIFASSDNGTTIVIQPGREYVELRRNRLEPFRSSPVCVGDRLYIRTHGHLFCIAEASTASAAP